MEHPSWWVYVVITISIFFGCLVLNYIVTKINEVRLEEHLIALQLKSPEGRVTQVQQPFLEFGETSHRPDKLPLPAIKNSELSPDMNLQQRDIPISETQIEKIITKPIFLGSIYRSTEMFACKSDELYFQDILNTVLDRMMFMVYGSKAQTDLLKNLEGGKCNDEFKKSESTLLSTEGITKAKPVNSIILNDLLDHVMMKVYENETFSTPKDTKLIEESEEYNMQKESKLLLTYSLTANPAEYNSEGS